MVSRTQLTGFGLGRGAIQHRLERKRLHPIHHGVYSVGRRRLTLSGAWMAAVLACGSGAVLSHRSAAVLWGLRRGDPVRTEVTVPRRLGRRKGIRTHRAILEPDEITEVDGIPISTAARTLLDLAAVVDRHEVRRAVEQAEALRLADHTPLTALVARHPGRRGTAVLKEILRSESRAAGITRSELEDRFLRFLAERELPAPRTNVWLQVGEDWFEADCVWSDERVAVELDSWAHHAGKAAFRRDRTRDRRLRAGGLEADSSHVLGSRRRAGAPRGGPARPHQRTSCHSMTPYPLSSSSPPGSTPENDPKGWR